MLVLVLVLVVLLLVTVVAVVNVYGVDEGVYVVADVGICVGVIVKVPAVMLGFEEGIEGAVSTDGEV